ncbi:TPA: mechanosensitive ion channel [Candidatus Micrarchaeota archaeon]|nr:mechanosensitive ion channel [Candidatus Micrarchaeota archaeon]HIH30204.1 mechanosensitive ion channel [Candidatus Micrarchaeota archaeon]
MPIEDVLLGLGLDARDLAVAALILVFGYIIGKTVKQFMLKISESSGVRQKLRFGIEKEVKKFGFSVDFTYMGALVLKYAIYLLAIFLAFRALNIEIGMNTVLLPLIAYIPNILGAAIILLVGSAIVEIVADIVKYRLRDAIDEKAGEIGPMNISTPIASLVRYFLYAIIFITAFLQLGIRAEGLLAFVLAASVVFLAAAAILAVFSLKDHVPNLTAGLYLRRSKIIGTGDTLTACGISGKVAGITTLATIVRNKGGTHYLPNAKITGGVFSINRKKRS